MKPIATPKGISLPYPKTSQASLRIFIACFFCCMFLGAVPLMAQVNVTAISQSYQSTVETRTYSGTKPSTPGLVYNNATFNYGVASGSSNNELRVSSFTAASTPHTFLPVGTQQVVFRRVNNAGVTGARQLVFLEGTHTSNTTPQVFNIVRPYEDDMATLFNGTLGFNAGTDNLFCNTGNGDGNINNIERVDVIFKNGLKVNSPTQAGFALFERGVNNAHDAFAISVILEVDGSGNPTRFSRVIRVASGSYGTTDLYGASPKNFVVLRKEEGQTNLLASAALSQNLGGVYFRLSDFNIAANQNIYGYVILPPDFVPVASRGLVDSTRIADFTNSTNYPTTTADGGTAGGIDLIATTGIAKVTGTNAIEPLGEIPTIPTDEKGTPTDTTTTTVTPEAKQKITTSLPEGESVPSLRPSLLSCTTNDLTITATTTVSVTFVQQSTTKTNALGYFTYPTSNPPSVAPDKSQIKLIFPNATDVANGGGLSSGTTVELGTFNAGTSISWVLVENGYNTSLNAVGDGTNVFYSNPALNPTNSATGNKYLVQFYDSTSNSYMMAWEDAPSGDNDFNDLIFSFKSSDPNACTTCNRWLTMNWTEASNASDGGLESISLGDAISQFRYSFIKNDGKYVPNEDVLDATLVSNYKNQVAQRNASRNGALALINYIPNTVTGNFTRKVSTPVHLLSFTNAIDVEGVNFLRNDNSNAASVLVMKTRVKPYDHTKAICDRVIGSVIKNIVAYEVDGFNFGRMMMLRKDGVYEYATSFSIAISGNSRVARIQADWRATAAAGADTLYNYQVWSSDGPVTNELVAKILNIFRQQGYQLEQPIRDNVVPSVFINKVERSANLLKLYVTNNLPTSTPYNITLYTRPNENVDKRTQSLRGTLQPGNTNVVNVQVFDHLEQSVDFSINRIVVDHTYAADTRWSTDYKREDIIMNSWTVKNNTNRNYPNNELQLMRGFAINFTALRRSDVSVYKLATVDGSPLNLNNFRAIKFKAKGNVTLQVRITKKSVQNFIHQYTKEITVGEDMQDYIINFAELTSIGYRNAFDASDVTSVVFLIKYPDYYKKALYLEVDEVAFVQTRTQQAPPVIVTAPVVAQPNPFNGACVAEFNSNSEEMVTIRVTDMNGMVIHQQVAPAYRGRNAIRVQVPGKLNSSMYKLNVLSPTQQFQTVTLVAGNK